MISDQTVQQAVAKIVAVARPRKIILFGSYARGGASEASDLDLMVIEPKVTNAGAETARLREAIGSIGMGIDVVVYSESEFERRKNWCTTPVYWALREGKVLYDAEKPPASH